MAENHFLHALLRRESGGVAELRVAASGTALATRLELAADSASRWRGLLGRDALAPGAALIIAPCGGIHTFGMRFAIDVVFAARDGRVLKIARAVGPRRVAMCLRAFAAIELAAGEADRHRILVGDQLEITRSDMKT